MTVALGQKPSSQRAPGKWGLVAPPWTRPHPARAAAPGASWLLARGYYQTHLPTRDPRPGGDTELCLPRRGYPFCHQCG